MLPGLVCTENVWTHDPALDVPGEEGWGAILLGTSTDQMTQQSLSLCLLFRRGSINLPPGIREIREGYLLSESADELEAQVDL